MDGKIDPLAHGQRLNAFLDVARPRFQTGSMEGGPWDGNDYTCALFCAEWDSQSKIEIKMQLRYVQITVG